MSDTSGESEDLERSGWFPRRRSYSASLGLLIFSFGTAAGFLLAFAGLGVVEESVGILLLVFLCILMFIAAFGLMIYVFRKPLLKRVFGFAETQLELFATPLSNVARGAVDRDSKRAVDAAQELVHLALARYAWLSTRRWVIGSLTALIAAMAALAGTAMLFRQNELLKDQTATLIVQNEMFREQTDTLTAQSTKIDTQIALADLSVQLAEAARNAELAASIVEITGELAREVSDASAVYLQDSVAAPEDNVALLDPEKDIDLGLVVRIVSASQAAKPYRYLDLGVREQDASAMLWQAAERRSEELPSFWSNVKDWHAVSAKPELIDRPASPERGQLLMSMVAAGIHDFERFNALQLDLSFASARGVRLFLCSLQVAQLRFADLSYATIRETDFGGAYLENTRFRKAVIRETSFARVSEDALSPYFLVDGAAFPTSLAGADFSGAFLRAIDYQGAESMLAVFDQGALIDIDFKGAALSGSTFRGAVLIGTSFDDAQLFKTDFDGAIVAGEDFLEIVATDAYPGSFDPAHYAMEPVDLDSAMQVEAFGLQVDPAEIEAHIEGKGFFRLQRVAPLED
ncbi:pentapeptide repeat-containing protein [Pseudoruegeria sp. HB172150]|uniref:pentapeptide repeat-containing protein n=1 Tax=Pseudoruegeria sp. HB172150 TaxID=2721164 RepID=UPI001556E648|nr:pentapeptide repeat-containing protein [Pseudoruegeria sp. HB172150]